jgi:hypothetical protein
MGAAGPLSGSPVGRRRLWVALGAVGSLILVALIVLLIVWRGGAETPGGAESAHRPLPTSSPAPLALALAPAPTPAPTPGVPHPSTCDQLYSPAMVAAFGDQVLNPAWAEAAGAGVRRGTDDPALMSIIDAAESLTCLWVDPNGGSGSGLTTSVVWVTPEQSAAVQARLAAAGMTCYEELGGLRCVVETTKNSDTWGESHFLRDGIWLATHYINAGPDGYTHDIIANVWAGA